MILALDAMGGDKAPDINVEGAILAVKQSDDDILLVGKQDILYAQLDKWSKKYSFDKSRIRVVNATEIIEMGEHPANAARHKKDSSMAVCCKLVAAKQADAFISMGNSGAAMATSLLYFKRISGISRPAISISFPTISGRCTIVDAGANVDCKPEHLLQFAIMGDIYSKSVLGVKNPKVAILSIGEEETKGNELVFETSKLLKQTDLNFIGNIEGGDIPKAKADVVVCDGFVGNVFLKSSEGIAEMILKLIKNSIKANPLYWGATPFLKLAMKSVRKKADYDEAGGAPLLGVNSTCIIGHGKSNSKAVKNALFAASRCAKKNISNIIEEEIKKFQN
ncbi:phosphate acyltransferase PlsX [Candidatus Ruminimicrobium bovinum]|uniref:phosphate acyltransferase PlsX n=1 Tax=Candidatus Ruminimicrobium bovinum TaxID=3242779 RepID=UPI0039B92E29